MTESFRTPQRGSGRASSATGLRRVNREPAEPMLVVVITIINALMRPLTFRDWRGQENVPTAGGVLLVANHISNVDPLALGQFVAFCGRWPRFLAKASLFRIPVIGQVIRACGQIPVERGGSSAGRAVAAADEFIQAGRAVVVYPEGTITLDPELWPMEAKSGAVRIALATGCPVIPIGQWGAQDIMWGKKLHFPRLLPRKTLRLIAGPPVPLDDLRGKPATAQSLAEATDRIMDAITALVAELRQEQPPTHRYDPHTTTEEPAQQDQDPT